MAWGWWWREAGEGWQVRRMGCGKEKCVAVLDANKQR